MILGADKIKLVILERPAQFINRAVRRPFDSQRIDGKLLEDKIRQVNVGADDCARPVFKSIRRVIFQTSDPQDAVAVYLVLFLFGQSVGRKSFIQIFLLQLRNQKRADVLNHLQGIIDIRYDIRSVLCHGKIYSVLTDLKQ